MSERRRQAAMKARETLFNKLMVKRKKSIEIAVKEGLEFLKEFDAYDKHQMEKVIEKTYLKIVNEGVPSTGEDLYGKEFRFLTREFLERKLLIEILYQAYTSKEFSISLQQIKVDKEIAQA